MQRVSSLLLIASALIGMSVAVQTAANTQTAYVTIYGQLTQFQCPLGAVSGPCTGFSIMTNGTTPGIPTSPMLDFSQSVVPTPTQNNVGTLIMATGHYGQEPSCSIMNGCPAFFVHTWGAYYPAAPLPTAVGCFSSSNPPTTWYQVSCSPPISGHEAPVTSSESTGASNPFSESISLMQLVSVAIIMIVVYIIIRLKKK